MSAVYPPVCADDAARSARLTTWPSTSTRPCAMLVRRRSGVADVEPGDARIAEDADAADADAGSAERRGRPVVALMPGVSWSRLLTLRLVGSSLI